MTQALVFMEGALVTLCAVASLAFARMWRRSRDRFFLLFALAFVVFGASWASLTWKVGEHAALPYVTRLAAFLMIIAAIVDKNRRI